MQQQTFSWLAKLLLSGSMMGGIIGLVIGGTAAEALAYIDPGTGATLIGSLGPLAVAFGIALLLLLIKLLWKPLTKKIFGAKDEDELD